MDKLFTYSYTVIFDAPSPKEECLINIPKYLSLEMGFAEIEGRYRRLINPALSAPYVNTYSLTSSEVVFEQFDPYTGTRRLPAKVLNFDSQKDSVEIEFSDPGLIPPTMWVPITTVKRPNGRPLTNPHTNCPQCGDPWHETQLARFSVWDCRSCGIKKEDYVKN